MALPTSEKQLVRAKEALGVKLLPGHRQRLLRSNGDQVQIDVEAFEDFDEEDGWFELHPVLDDSDQKRASRSTSHLVRETEDARTWPGFPSDAISIANGGGGDRLIYRPGTGVQWWDPETGEAETVNVLWNADVEHMQVDEAVIRQFVTASKSERYLGLAKSPKRRKEWLAALPHFNDFDQRFVEEVSGDQSPTTIAQRLRSYGAPDECEVISENAKLDGQTLKLDDALAQVIDSFTGTILSCVVGELAFFEGEEIGVRFILRHKA